MSPRTSTALALLVVLILFAVPASGYGYGSEQVSNDPGRVAQAPPNGPQQQQQAPERAVVVPWKGSVVDMSHEPMPITVGPIVIGAFHVFPAQQPGPYIGPPGRIWGLGFGTSLWRDPVTGWPEM